MTKGRSGVMGGVTLGETELEKTPAKTSGRLDLQPALPAEQGGHATKMS